MEQSDLREELRRLHVDSFGWAVCCARNFVEAEEILQITYLKVLQGRAKFAAKSTFKTWLFGVIRLTAIDRRRWNWIRRSRESSPAADQDQPDNHARPDEATDRREQSSRLTQALMQLSRRQREILQLTFYQGLSIAEAADVMEVKIGSARTHYERGKLALRRLLEPDGTHDERRSSATLAASSI